MFDFSAPEDVVFWYSATGRQSGDAFYGFGGFFNGSIPSVKLYGTSGLAQLGLDPNTVDIARFSGLTADELSSVEVANLFLEGETSISPVDPNILGPLPDGYTTYNNLSFDIQTEADISGPNVVTFTVPSVTDPTVFLNLRVFHAEQDPFEPDSVIWVDRTILPPDPQAPDFSISTISARTKLLGQFVVASLTSPQPATGTANIFVSASHAPTQIIAGGDVTYTLNIINNGPDTAFGIRLVDSLSPNSVFISATPSQGTCSFAEGKVVCKLQSLNSGASAAVSIVATLTEGGLQIPAQGLEIGNTVNVRANETDANLDDNIATDSLMLLRDPNSAPTVSISSPASGDMFVGPANITISANASDSDGTIASLELFDNGGSIGMAGSIGPNEYSFNWTNAPFGEHSLLAVATDNTGKQSASSTANILVNGSANVTIINPASWTEFATTASLNITASASLSGGSISKIDFYANGELLGTGALSGTDQYSLTWSPLHSGSFFLVAVATDNSGIATTSKPVEVRVRENTLPSVNITAPVNGSHFATPGNVVLTAGVSDSDGAVTLVDFYANGTKIGSGSVSGADLYSFTWSNPSAGNYSLTAIAVDDTNQSTTSGAVNITVSAPPTATITSPVNGTQYSALAQVTIVANASDSDGTIARTDFYANGAFIGTGTASGGNQYSFNWTNVGIGNYTLTAVAVDNSGASTTSTSISISVTSPVLFVANSTTLNTTENLVKTRLETLNHTVVVKSAASAVTADANGKALVVISSTATPSAVGTKFRTVTVPVLTWESGLYTNMGMTGSSNKDFGTKTNQTQLTITNSTHPLAAGLSGNTTTATSGTFNWGKPNANAVSVAIVVGDATKTVIFGYESGAVMPGLTAPARRVGFFMHDTTALNSSGTALLDAAIRWAIGGGSLSKTITIPIPASVDLTAVGAVDWAHWGLNGPANFNHKSNVAQQISNFTPVGTASTGWFIGGPTTFTWTNGTPTVTASTQGGLVRGSTGNGYEITVPADANLKTLKLYVGSWYGQSKLEATLSDGSASAFEDTSLNSCAGGAVSGIYTINFRAGSSGQTLKVRYTLVNDCFAPNGAAALQSAVLQ